MINVFKLLPLGDWLWIGVATSLIGYHVVSLERAKHDVRDEVNAEWTQKVAVANAQAKADHDAQQTQIETLASASQPKIKEKLDSINAQLGTLTAQAKKPPKVFAADCVLQLEQVESFNAIK